MSLSPETRTRIERTLADNRVVLFMKGDPPGHRAAASRPRPSASSTRCSPDYASVDVLADPEIREGIKEYGQWPTIPQLYVGGELVGGSDIIEGHAQLRRTARGARRGRARSHAADPQHHAEAPPRRSHARWRTAEPGVGLHLGVDPRFNAQFQLKPVTGQEIVAEAAGLRIHFDLASAPRAEGIAIDWVEDVRGAGLAISNPKAPPPVKSIVGAANCTTASSPARST